MRPGLNTTGFVAMLATVASLALTAACGDSVPLGTLDRDAAVPGTGGAIGAGGSSADASSGTGGIKAGSGGGAGGGAGGSSVADAPLGTGGGAGQTGGRVGTGGSSIGTGGRSAGGGALGTGGKAGTGGATSSGGSTGKTCGTIAGLTCSAGQFCDFPAPGCGKVPDGAGVCRATGAGLGCTDDYVPVCGCDGQTYSNDCERIVTGVLKASDGACGGGTGGKTGTGGKPGTGGSFVDGGAPGSGGRTGTGGATGTGEGSACGGPAATTCGAGLYCDLASNCGQIANATGTCRITGPNAGCSTASNAPVCGCDGKTYDSDCARNLVGMLRASIGACPARDGGAQLYPTAYLAWQAPGGVAGTGPAVVVSGGGWADTWENTAGFSPEAPPSSATKVYTLTSTQTDDLFARLAAVNISSLPHPSTLGYECYTRLYFRLCQGCAATTLDYGVPPQVAPEMDPVWLWFDQLLGSGAQPNPRGYCGLVF